MAADLTLERVSFRYPGASQDAVDELELSVPAGSMTALLGSSGSGKSTVLRLAGGLLQPRSGEVRLDGASLSGTAPQDRRMAMMFQRPLLFPHLSVIDNVAFSARVSGLRRGAARAHAARFLDLVHLGEMAQRRSRELSGGQEQRVALARALAATPEVLLLDEPFGALDTAVRESMYALLEEIRAVVEPTIVLVTHDLGEASLADEVAVLAGGHVLQRGTVHQLHATPATVHVARLLGGFSELPGEVRNGAHCGPAGCLPLLPANSAPEGPATLLVHRQAVRLLEEGTAAHPSDGVHLLSGVVTRIGSAMLSRRLTVVLADRPHGGEATLSVEVDVPGGSRAEDRTRVGDRVRLSVSAHGTWAVSDHGAPGTQSPGHREDAASPGSTFTS